jgi:hypothetical protein
VSFLTRLIDDGVAGRAKPIATDYGALEKQQIVSVEPIFPGAWAHRFVAVKRDSLIAARDTMLAGEVVGGPAAPGDPLLRSRSFRDPVHARIRLGRKRCRAAPPGGAAGGRARRRAAHPPARGGLVTALAHLKKGPAWEYRMHRALFASGWYVRRNVDLRERIAGSPQTMAEVDLLGLSFDAGLNARRLVGECKDRKGSTKEADRVIWLLGLGQLLDADELLFAKPRIAAATVHFARSTSVALHEEAGVLRIESAVNGVEVAGAFDPAIGEDLIRPATDRKLFGDSRLRDAYDWVHNASWYEDPLARVKRLPGYFRLVTAAAAGDTRRVLVIEGILAVLACALQVAGILRRHAPQVARALASDTLASGAAPASALREIAARADEYYRDVLDRVTEVHSGQRAMLEIPRLAEHIAAPPRWADAFFSFADSLGARPESATDVLRFAELELFESLAGRDPAPAQRTYVRGDHGWLAGTLASAAGFCQRLWHIDDPQLDQLLNGGSGSVADDNGTRAGDPPQRAPAAEAHPARTGTQKASPDGAHAGDRKTHEARPQTSLLEDAQPPESQDAPAAAPGRTSPTPTGRREPQLADSERGDKKR